MPRERLSRSDNPPGVQPGRGGALSELRQYGLAILTGMVGLIGTVVAGWKMDQWAQARDAERFAAECRMVGAMIEQKMERYETALNRLQDVCARTSGEISSYDWGGWLGQTLGLSDNYPNIRCLVVAPLISRADQVAFGRRAAAQVGGHPGTILTSRTQADRWAPVWRRLAKAKVALPELGDDLLAETPERPSLEPALAVTFGWVTDRPVRLQQQDGSAVVGFWIVLPLRPLEFTNAIMWQARYESGPEADQRRRTERAQRATGVLAAFISGDDFLAEFSATNRLRLVQVQVFTTSTNELSAKTLLNPGQPAPISARFTHNEPMSWYGRRWTARFHSAPLFEASSLRYRSWLIWSIGTLLSLGMASTVAWQTRGRLREAALAAQLRIALSRQERLSRDLHDGTLQSVFGVGLGLQRVQRLLEKQPDAAAEQLADTTQGMQRVVRELRAFIRETDPIAHEEVSLGEALHGVIGHFKSAAEMELQLEVAPGADHSLTPAQSLQLLNIAREALSNSVRHSQARHVKIGLKQTSGAIRLEVDDDGNGFDPEAAQHEGRGLSNLAMRVRELGGSHRWEASAGRGSRLIVEVPLAI